MKPATSPIPSFYLYGEAQRTVEKDFVHVESLDDRSRPSEWTIQPHLHRDLHHLILICEGGGAMRADDVICRFTSPALLLVPSGMVHGFQWFAESRGWVISFADSYYATLVERDPDLAPLFRTAAAIVLDNDDCLAIERHVSQLMLELGWIGPAQHSAVEAEILAIMVRSVRRAKLARIEGDAQGRHAAIVAHLRARIDQRFRLRETVDVHARALGVSATALRLACARVGGVSPAAMLDQRAMLEARRLLLYTKLTINQVGYAIGIEDPAYFSRFFTRHAGQTPRSYRASSERP
ncbi:MAG: helix-turn-helix domain-containing protein [Novosphingobium sp.]